jgi:hypothetical protein
MTDEQRDEQQVKRRRQRSTHRDGQTDEERHRVLDQDQARLQAEIEALLLSVEDAMAMDAECAIPIQTPARIAEIQAEFASRVARGGTFMKTCCVCDLNVPSTDMVVVKIDGLPLAAMKERLVFPHVDVGGGAPVLPEELCNFYNCEDVDVELACMPLSRRGLKRVADASPDCNLCLKCKQSLTDDRVRGPPEDAIANGHFMGLLPARFVDSTPAEIAMCSRAQIGMRVNTIYGGNGHQVWAASFKAISLMHAGLEIARLHFCGKPGSARHAFARQCARTGYFQHGNRRACDSGATQSNQAQEPGPCVTPE